VTQLLERTRAQYERAQSLDESKREQKFAAIAAGGRRKLEKIDQRSRSNRSCRGPSAGEKDVEREGLFLDRLAQRAQEQRQRYAAEQALRREHDRQRIEMQQTTPQQRAIRPTLTIEEQEQTKSRGCAARRCAEKLAKYRGVGLGAVTPASGDPDRIFARPMHERRDASMVRRAGSGPLAADQARRRADAYAESSAEHDEQQSQPRRGMGR
jgi:hypothetical protein